MAMAMALFVLEYSFKKLTQLKSKTKSMLASWVVNSTDELSQAQRNMMIPSNKPEPKKPNFKPQVAKNMQDPQGQYMWLFSGYR